MKKETRAYIRHVLKSEYVQLDVLNTMLAFTIIVFALIAFLTGGKLTYFGAVFVIGGVLSVFNLIKSIMTHSSLGIMVFGFSVFMMMVFSFVVYAILL